jgi:polysaccharide biosynthesis protein PslH
MDKILYITPYLPFPNNKAANLFISKRIELLSSKYTIDLLSVTNGKYNNNIQDFRIKNYIKNFHFIQRKPVGIKSIISAFIQKESLFNLLSVDIINKISELLKSNTYSYVIIEHSYLSSYIIQKIPSISAKAITVFHNIEQDYFYDLYKKTKFKNPKKVFYYLEYIANKQLENKLYETSTKSFWFLSNHDLINVQNKTNNKNLLLSPTINFTLKNHSKSEKKYDLLYMGQLDNERNLHGLKWFINNVWELLDDTINFAIVGRGDTNTIQSIINQRNNITLIGEVNNLDQIFSQAKLTIIPIFNTIGVQTKLFDSLSQGNITICSEDAVNGTIFQDEQHLLIAKDKNDFANKIHKVLNNINSYSFLYSNLQQLTKNFESSELIKEMEGSLNAH